MSRLLYSIGYFINELVYKDVKQARRLFNTFDKLDGKEFKEYLNLRFYELVNHANDNVKYYNDVFRSLNIDVNNLKDISEIKKIPVLTKEIIRANYSNLIDRNIENYKTLARRSGGTTGEPIRAIIDRYTQALETMSFMRGLHWMGWNPDMKCIRLTGGSLGFTNKFNLKTYLRNKALNATLLPAFELNKDNARDYLNVIQNSGDCVIIGYASVLYNLAEFRKKFNIDCSNVKNIFSTAEILTTEWANSISESFNCEVKCYYGTGEVESVGYQIKQDGDYVISDDTVYIESETVDNIESQLLITSLYNRPVPFIRYLNGDMGILETKTIWGRERKVISKLIGRKSDMLRTLKGNYVSGMFAPHAIFQSGLPVKKYQFIQWNINEIEFKYQPENVNDLSDLQKNSILTLLNNVLEGNNNIIIKFTKTSDFLLTKSGKHRITINQVN